MKKKNKPNKQTNKTQKNHNMLFFDWYKTPEKIL